jgi:molybdate transport system regulatory protein
MRFVVRADAVTLHEPSVSPERDSTSARNRLAGTVIGVDADESVALVTVTVGDAVDLHALVTTESIDRLALEVGVPVVASFKATATRGIPAVDLPKN